MTILFFFLFLIITIGVVVIVIEAIYNLFYKKKIFLILK